MRFTSESSVAPRRPARVRSLGLGGGLAALTPLALASVLAASWPASSARAQTAPPSVPGTPAGVNPGDLYLSQIVARSTVAGTGATGTNGIANPITARYNRLILQTYGSGPASAGVPPSVRVAASGSAATGPGAVDAGTLGAGTRRGDQATPGQAGTGGVAGAQAGPGNAGLPADYRAPVFEDPTTGATGAASAPSSATSRPPAGARPPLTGRAPSSTRPRPGTATGRLTPYQMCVRDGGCEGLSAAP